jgi:hypothetical protein
MRREHCEAHVQQSVQVARPETVRARLSGSEKQTGPPTRAGPPPPASGWQRLSAMWPRRTNVSPACTREPQRQGSATWAGTSGKQRSTALLPPRAGSAPNVSSRFSPTMNGRGLLPSPTSHATAWPDSRYRPRPTCPEEVVGGLLPGRGHFTLQGRCSAAVGGYRTSWRMFSVSSVRHAHASPVSSFLSCGLRKSLRLSVISSRLQRIRYMRIAAVSTRWPVSSA